MKRAGRLLFNLAAGVSAALFFVTLMAWGASFHPAIQRSMWQMLEGGATPVQGFTDWGAMRGWFQLLRISAYKYETAGWNDGRYKAVSWNVAGLKYESIADIPRLPDRMGIYWRIRTVQISCAWPACLAGGCALLAFRRGRRAVREPGTCLACGYDLRATPDRCPECGTAAEPKAGAGQGPDERL